MRTTAAQREALESRILGQLTKNYRASTFQLTGCVDPELTDNGSIAYRMVAARLTSLRKRGLVDSRRFGRESYWVIVIQDETHRLEVLGAREVARAAKRAAFQPDGGTNHVTGEGRPAPTAEVEPTASAPEPRLERLPYPGCQVTGRWAHYFLLVNGTDIGTVERVQTQGRDSLAGNRTYSGWRAGGRVVETQLEAEAWLVRRQLTVINPDLELSVARELLRRLESSPAGQHILGRAGR